MGRFCVIGQTSSANASSTALFVWMIIDWIKMKKPSLVGVCVGAGVGSPEHVTWSWARTNKDEVARRRTRGMVKAW